MDRVGPYQIIEEIGRGGMGVVYRALDEHIGRPVAVKVIRFEDLTDPEELELLRGRLFREARAAGILKHPGIVTIYFVGEDQEIAYIAMEYVSGPTLEQLLLSGAAMDKEHIRRILLDTAAALDYAHKKGIIHRDVKPANIMLEDGETVKICDFGIAKGFTGMASMTQTGTVIGTPHYMAPEQIMGKPVDARADQYALAVIAFQMLTGRRPFQADSIHNLFYRIMAEPPAAAHKLNPGLPEAVAQVVEKALAKDPAGRYASCLEFVTELLRTCDTRPDWTPPPPRAATGTGMTPVRGTRRTSSAPTIQPAPPPAPKPPENPPSPGFTELFAGLAPEPVPPDAEIPAPRWDPSWRLPPPFKTFDDGETPAAPEPPAPVFSQPPPRPKGIFYGIGAAVVVLAAAGLYLAMRSPAPDVISPPAPDKVVEEPPKPSGTGKAADVPAEPAPPKPVQEKVDRPAQPAPPNAKVVPVPPPKDDLRERTYLRLGLTPSRGGSPWADQCVQGRQDPEDCVRQLREATYRELGLSAAAANPRAERCIQAAVEPAACAAQLRTDTCRELHLSEEKCAANPWARRCIASAVEPAACARQLQERLNACLSLRIPLDKCVK